MPIDQGGDPWSGTTYKGFAGAPTGQAEPPVRPARRRRLPARSLTIGGVIAALALGVVFGLWTRPELIGGPSRAKPAAARSQTASTATPGAAQVPIAVAPGAGTAAAPPQAPGRLETLPPEMAAAERAPARPHEAGEASENASATAAESTPQAPPALAGLNRPDANPPAAAEPGPQVRASFDCATARPGAEQMVCADPELAAADRQMSRAYRRALRSGADPADLRQEQRDWIAIREDAARHSRRALGQVYDQRIQDLNQIADEGGPENEPDDGQ